MKVIQGKYPEEKDWQKYIRFNVGPEVNLVTKWRAAAYIRDHYGKQCTVIGLRTYANQQTLYDAWVKYKAWVDGGKKGTAPPTANQAAAPGNSWHNVGFAIDFNRISTVNGQGVYPGTLNSDFELWKAGKAEVLNQYGLCHAVSSEPWHVQPIESRGYTGDKGYFADIDDLMDTSTGYPKLEATSPNMTGKFVELFQTLVNKHIKTPIPVDGAYGSKQSKPAAEEFQKMYGLTVDGIVGGGTWGKLIEKPSCDSCESYKKQISQLKASISGLQTTIKSEQSKHATDLSTLQKQVINLNSQLDSISSQLKSEKGKTATLTNNLSTAQTQINSLTKELMLVEADREVKLSDLKQIAKAQIIIEKYK
ncbi:MAG: peptidoglycan-binding protein [Candidatus Paceibacterota bacterium]|jgi:peptidoglycan hydrolase-like protein with peptidoglycan-binding domain